MQKPKNPIW